MSLPSGPLDGLLCAFSSSSSKFALATPDGRVRTYDTGGLVCRPGLLLLCCQQVSQPLACRTCVVSVASGIWHDMSLVLMLSKSGHGPTASDTAAAIAAACVQCLGGSAARWLLA